MKDEAVSRTSATFEPANNTRPISALLKYYFIIALFTTVGFPFLIFPLFFRYHTMRYIFDDKGISMSWGILFRKEVYLTYRRIQDIHVSRNLLQRWLGLATVSVQTASGSSDAEMTIEGIKNPEALRDFLYSKMRGTDLSHPSHPQSTIHSHADEALLLLREIRDKLNTLTPVKNQIPSDTTAKNEKKELL